ncbi:hypothetical protein C1H46_016915 [Malus baccata]|uniref:NAC domain-containing protein n=1 Tax=Malus baccata TaxID=106549 RepID=A0A540MFE7_MALBA|nr:hypothetical protein C1H46_016915 [Malus baccata]
MENSSTTTRTTTAQSVPDMVAAIRFHPTEKEMADFLRKKMKSHKSQACHFLPVIDVCKFEPWDLPERMFPDSVFQAKAWYSFSWCDYKYINSLRCNRVTEHGFWKITGKPRDISLKYFTCKKRTLTFQIKTFQEGGASKSVRTGWIIHEYYCTKPKQGSSPHQERDLKRDYVICLLKYKPDDSKSDKKKPEGTSVCDDLADPGNSGYIASSPGNDHTASAAAMNHMIPDTEEVLAYKQLEDDLLGSGYHDHGEPGGSVSSDSIDQALCDMIHESYAPLGGFLDLLFPPPEPPQPPQPHQPPQLGIAPDIYSHELVDPGSGTGGCIPYNFDNQAAAMNHMIPNTEEILADKQPERAVLASGNHDDGEPGIGISSDFIYQAVDDMTLEFYDQLEKDLDSPLSPPGPPKPHQLGNFPDVHSGEFNNWPSTIGDNDFYDIIKNNIATNYDNEPVINIAYNSQNLAPNERISEPHQPPQLGIAPDIYSHELVDPGSGTGGCIPYNFDNQAAAMNHMIPNTEEILADKQPERAVLASGNHDDGEPGIGISSDFIYQAVDDMTLEFYDQLEKDLDSPLSPPGPPQPHQLRNFPDVHSGKFSNWPSTIGDNDSYDIIKNNIATNYDNEPVINIAYNSQNLAPNERISEAYSQPEENWGSPFQQFDQLQNYTLQSCAPAGEYLNSLFPLPQSPQPHQPPQLGNAPDVCSDESIDPGTGGCITYNTDNQAAAMNHVISDTEEILTYKQLELAVLGNGNHGDGEPSSGISSYFIDQALNDMILEFPAGLQKDLDSPFPPPEPPQTHQPHQLGDVPDAHIGEFSNCPSPIGDNGFYLTNKNNIATSYDNELVINITHNSPNCATNERISEAYSQPEENRGSPFQLFHQLQNYPLQSPILFSELGELLLANTCIGRNESQSFNMEPATLFPQSS